MSPQIHISMAGYQGPGSVHTRGLEAFRDALTERMGDRVEVTVRANVGPEGIKTEDVPSLTEAGDFDVCYIASSYLAARVPALALFDMPFAAPERDRALDLVDGPLGARFGTALAEATNLVLLGVWDNGQRHMAANRPLRNPCDCTGLVLRTLPNADHQRVFRALGFEPRVIDAKDLTAAVSGGEVDAQENPLTNTYNFGLHGALPHVTLTGHLMGIALLVINKDRLATFPDDIRTAVIAAAKDATKVQRSLARSDDAVCTKALTDEGATLITLTDDERDAWRAAAAPHVAQCRAQQDADLLALYEADMQTPRGVVT